MQRRMSPASNQWWAMRAAIGGVLDVLAVAVGERIGVGGMERGGLPGQEVRLDDLAHQRVAEVVGVVVDDEHLVRHGVAQPPDQVGLGQAGDPQQQLVGDRRVPGAGRDGSQQLLDVGIERIDPGAEHLLELGRHLVEVVDRHRQLLHEERDATRTERRSSPPTAGSTSSPVSEASSSATSAVVERA